jgi:peptidoglycan hydrolase-like protein with peptidoglycan-binding domain
MVNNSSDVRFLQQKLRTISQYNNSIPVIGVDGIFGPETTTAVAAFQRVYGLPVTGQVDEDTWMAIDSEYLRVTGLAQQPSAISPFTVCLPELHQGDSGDLVYVLQVMLRAIAARYPNVSMPEMTGVFDEATDDALRSVQSASGLTPHGRLDKETWNAIAALYNINGRMC